MAQASGTCDARFGEVRRLLEQFVASGEELGASIVVDIDGETVVDVWGGYTDAARTQAWQRDTLVNVFSCTKTVASLAALMLIDRGLVQVEAPVARYWPEFGANGKEGVTVRHVLAHSAGVSGWEEAISIQQCYDFDGAAGRLAAQAPWWAPGSTSGYHVLTMGFLVGELVRRVAGKTLGQFVADEIARPLGADFQLGAKEADWPRITDMVPPCEPSVLASLVTHDDASSVAAKSLLNPVLDPNEANTPAWRAAELGAANGHANARALVRILSAITLGGQVGGKRLLSPDTISLIFHEQSYDTDLVLGVPIRLGLGYGLTPSSTNPQLPAGTVCFWSGFGGSFVVMDLDRRLTMAYVMNKMAGGLGANARGRAYGTAVYCALGLDVNKGRGS